MFTFVQAAIHTRRQTDQSVLMLLTVLMTGLKLISGLGDVRQSLTHTQNNVVVTYDDVSNLITEVKHDSLSPRNVGAF